jgi:hypothetical protein
VALRACARIDQAQAPFSIWIFSVLHARVKNASVWNIRQGYARDGQQSSHSTNQSHPPTMHHVLP